jgi:hypothetical protein
VDEAVALAHPDDDASLAQAEVEEATLLAQSELDADADVSGDSLEWLMDSVGAAEEASQSLTEAEPEGLADPDSHTEVKFPLSLALALGSNGTCPVGVGGTQTVCVLVMSTTTVVVAVMGRPRSSRATSR